uniref:CHK domain-containing protein n=1 Tax=Caenorhabditis tropicalis TaxID=1561998 RepID=A0A1I7TQM8_9PELO
MSVEIEESPLFQNGEGLFSTHVYLEDLQQVIKEQMNTEAQLGENTKYTVVGDGNVSYNINKYYGFLFRKIMEFRIFGNLKFMIVSQGFMSRVVLVEPEWTICDERLPTKFVLKITSCMHVLNVLKQMNLPDKRESALWTIFEYEAQGLHNREVGLYKIFEKWNIDDLLLSPKVYFSRKFDTENQTKGFFGMEFVENAITRHVYVNLKPYELHSILKALAIFQAEGLRLNEEEKTNIIGYDLKKIVGKMFSENGLKNIFAQAKQINPEELSKIADKVKAFGLELVNFDLVQNLNKYLGIEQDVLVHGDLWSANILWTEKEGKLSVNKIIDYQSIHFGNPAQDLVRLFTSTLSGYDRNAYWEMLVDRFYEYFIDYLGDKEVPYTLEQLKESYRYYFVTGSLLMLPMLGPIAKVKLAEKSDPEEIEDLRNFLTEKAKYILEDMEHWHMYSRMKTKEWSEAEITNYDEPHSKFVFSV